MLYYTCDQFSFICASQVRDSINSFIHSIREYESQAAYTHAFSDLKKNIREGIYPLVQFNALLVLQPIFQLFEMFKRLMNRLSSEMMYNNYSALAVICLTKGCIEGIAQQRISIVVFLSCQIINRMILLY